MTAPLLTDLASYHRNLARARKAPALFLRAALRDDLEERLSLVNRSFPKAAVMTGFPEVWAGFEGEMLAPSETLSLAPASQDLIILDLVLHWANDPVGLLVQARHALRPDGLLLAPLFGGQTLHELRAVLAESEIAVTGGLSPRVLPMAEIRDLGALLHRAGFALPVADTQLYPVSYPHLLALCTDLRAMGETNALAQRKRKFTRKSIFLDAARRYAASFPAAEGRIEASFEIICLTGWAPHPSQPQPLRRGSASHSLEDVLSALAVTPRQGPDVAVDAAPKPNN